MKPDREVKSAYVRRLYWKYFPDQPPPNDYCRLAFNDRFDSEFAVWEETHEHFKKRLKEAQYE